MPTREIGTRFKLEGEQKFQKAMTDAASAVKTLNAEEKLAKAIFEETGDAQQYAADQARILKEKINEQKKAVAAAEEAVRRLTENGFDKNSSQMQKWRTKLANAQTTLKNTQNRLKKVEEGLQGETTEFGNTQSAANEYQDQMEKVNKGIDFQNTILAIDNITQHIETIIKSAAKAAKALWEMGVDAGKWADDITTAANEAGVDPATYQSWQYASRFVDTSVEDIVKNWRDIDNKLAQTGDNFYEYAGSLAQMGVATMTTSNKIRQGKDVFWDLIDSLHNTKDEGERSAKALAIFGNDWRKLNPLILAGSKAYQAYAEEGRSVAVVSNENVQRLGELDDEVQKLGAQFDKLKYDTLAELAPTFKQVAEAMGTAVAALNEFVQSEEGQKALEGLNDALSGVISSFLGDDNGKGTFESIVTNAKKAVEGFTGAMEWIKNNGWAVSGTVAALAIAWSGLKVTKEVLTFAQLLSKMGGSGKGSIFSGLFGKKASADSLSDSFTSAAKTFDEAAKTASSSAEAAKSAAAAAESSSGAASSSATAAESSSGAASGSATAAESSSGAASGSASAAQSSATAAESSSAAASSSATAAESSAAAASSSASAAESSAAAVGESVTSAANSALAAAESAAGAAEARAALEAGSAGALESAAGAAAARVEAEAAAQQAMEAAARAKLGSGASNLLNSGSSFLQNLFGNGFGIRPTLNIPLNPGAGRPTFPSMLPSGGNPLRLPSGSGAQTGGLSAAASAAAKVLGSTAGKALGGAGLFLTTLLTPVETAKDDLDTLTDDLGNLTTAGKELAEVGTPWFADQDQAKELIAVTDEQRAAAERFWDALRTGGYLADETSAAFDDMEAAFGANSEALDQLFDQMAHDYDWSQAMGLAALEDLPDDWFTAAVAASAAFDEGVAQATETAAANAKISGENVAVGLANGIDAKAGEAVAAARFMAGKVANIVTQTLAIHSPSKVMENLGEFTGLGFAEGIDRSSAAVERAVGNMVAATTRRPAIAIGGVSMGRGAGAYAARADAVNVTIMLDDQVLGSVMAPVINEKIGAKIQSVRR